MVQIGVADTGEGIAEDKMHLVFQKFGQIVARQSGTVKSTGLGLTFCKMAVEAHRGEIGLISNVGKGATFWFTLHAGNAENISMQGFVTSNTEEDKHIAFTKNDRAELAPIITRLRAFTIYETDDIEEILRDVMDSQSKNIQKWVTLVKKNLITLNQSRFIELLSICEE